MSEKIYAWLLRLYPSQFREAYGSEALQLFRDRFRDEKGFFRCMRLWFDLIVDLVISIPREYGYAEAPPFGAPVPQSLNGVPIFCVVEGGAPRPGAMLSGGILSCFAVFTFWLALNHAGNYMGFRIAATDRLRNDSKFFQPEASQADRQSHAPVTSGTQALKLDAEERRRVIDAAVVILRTNYVERENAQKMADVLLAHAKRGDYDNVTEAETFAALLTRQMREVSNDRHLTLDYSQEPFPKQPLGETPEEVARYGTMMKARNCDFEKVEILPRNIGYLKLNSFPGPTVCKPTAEAAMASLNRADAIIFDLRDNRGGEPAMVMLIAAYLFDHPEYMYNPRENTTDRSWTRSPVPGNSLADKPVFILTSRSTFSGAEHFSYDMKMLKRATIVGETTGGAAHSGVWHRIDDHFGMGIPETKAINPFSTGDWAEIGVEPDVRVKAADALVTAEKLAQDKLQKK